MRLKSDYRIADTATGTPAKEETPATVMKGVWESNMRCPRSQLPTFLKRLTSGQRAFLALSFLESEVLNGGIHQYLWNSSGNTFHESLKGLETVGAREHLGLLRKVEHLFIDSAALKNQNRRRSAVKKIGTKALDEIFDTPFSRLEAKQRTRLETFQNRYLRKHRDQFILPPNVSEELIRIPKPGEYDYRATGQKVRELGGEELHWALISKIWDDYHDQLRTSKNDILSFLPALSDGQRALVAIDIFNKTVLHLGGIGYFLADQAGADVLVSEVLQGFNLLGARRYAALLKKGMFAAGDLVVLNRNATEKSRNYQTAKESGDSEAIRAAGEEFKMALKSKTDAKDSHYEYLAALTDEIHALEVTEGHSIERYIDDYVRSHPDAFFR